MKTLSILIFILSSVFCADEFALVLTYQSNKPAYVVIIISGSAGKIGYGLIDSKEFTISEEQKREIIKLGLPLRKYDKEKFGQDMDFAMTVGSETFMYKDKFGNKERKDIYESIIKTLKIDILKGFEIPDEAKDFSK